MMNKTKLIKLLLAQLLTSPAVAMINVHEGAFMHREVDLAEIERIYHSRSSQIGIFGFGWCSEIEARIRKTSARLLSLYDCQTNRELRFRPDPDRPGDWLAENAAQERLLAARGSLIRPQARGGFQTFDFSTGRLVGITERAGRVLRVKHHRNGLPLKLEADGKAPILFSYDSSQSKLTGLTRNQESINFLYTDDDLTTVIRADRTKLAYAYDHLHNLERLHLNGYPLQSINYDRNRDLVLSVSRGACESRLSYRTSQRLITAEARRVCAGQIEDLKKFEFTYKEKADGETALTKLRINNEEMK